MNKEDTSLDGSLLEPSGGFSGRAPRSRDSESRLLTLDNLGLAALCGVALPVYVVSGIAAAAFEKYNSLFEKDSRAPVGGHRYNT